MVKFGMAPPLKCVEDVRLLKEHGTSTDDVNQPGALHVLISRSPHAHADIIAIDTKAADLDADKVGRSGSCFCSIGGGETPNRPSLLAGDPKL